MGKIDKYFGFVSFKISLFCVFFYIQKREKKRREKAGTNVQYLRCGYKLGWHIFSQLMYFEDIFNPYFATPYFLRDYKSCTIFLFCGAHKYFVFERSSLFKIFLYPLFEPLFGRPWIKKNAWYFKIPYKFMRFTIVWNIKVFVWFLKKIGKASIVLTFQTLILSPPIISEDQ